MIYQNFLSDILFNSSEIASEKFGKVTGITKANDNNQVLTEADLVIGTMIIAKIKKEFPDYNIIDEEAGVIDNGSEFTWVIDPIDGTSNFASGVPTYGIMVGLLHHDVPIAGGVVVPFFKQIVIAEKGKGAFSNGKRIFVTKETNLLTSLVAYHIDSHRDDPQKTIEECKLLAEIILQVRNIRSSSSVYDGILVASGHYGANLNRTSKIWDNVALHVVIEEAGGLYTDFYGKPMDYSKPVTKAKENFTFCCASVDLHSQLQKIIHQNKI